MLDRRQCLAWGGLLGTSLLFPPSWAADPTLPVAGQDVPELKDLDLAFRTWAEQQKIPALSIALAREGKLVYARTIGYVDREKRTPAPANALFRIASVSKPLTATAVFQLIEKGLVKLDDRILDHIKLTPLLAKGEKFDKRWEKVTLRQCLQHTIGLDREKSGDPITKITEILKLTGGKPPISSANVIRYALGRPLDFDPGTQQAYTNIGYLLAGQLIAKLARQSYADSVLKTVWNPVKVTQARLGRAIPEQRFKTEVRYYDSQNREFACLYPPRVGKLVPIPDGGENFEAYEAHGGWVASAVDLVRFATAFDDVERCPLLKKESIEQMWAPPPGEVGHDKQGKPLPAYYACGWTVRPTGAQGVNAWHTGRISGTSALLVRLSNRICWAVLCSTDTTADVKEPALVADGMMHQQIAKIKNWPDHDLFS